MTAHATLLEYAERGTELQLYETASLHFRYGAPAVFAAAADLIKDGRATEDSVIEVLLELVGFKKNFVQSDRTAVVQAIRERLARDGAYQAQ